MSPESKRSSFRRLVTSFRIVPANELNLLDEGMPILTFTKARIE
jgi:hypothetical protein